MQLISRDGLERIVAQGKILENALPANTEGIKYDLRISSMLLSGDYPNSIDINQLDYEKRNKLVVAPGELIFLLTEEIVNLPDNIIALLVFKRKMNHEGVQVLGGSVVDPLYSGRLLFGLYNFSSEPFPVIPGKKIMSIMFYQLDGEEIGEFPKPEARIDSFPDELLRNMSKYKPTSQQQLERQLLEVKTSLEQIKKNFKENEQWFREFKISLKDQSQLVTQNGEQIKKLSQMLEKETESRITSQDKIADKLDKYKDAVIYVKIFAVAGGLSIVAALIKYLLS